MFKTIGFIFGITLFGYFSINSVQGYGKKTAEKYCNENCTSIRTDGGCKLYTKKITFTRYTRDTEASKKTTKAYIDFYGKDLTDSDYVGECANNSGIIELIFNQTKMTAKSTPPTEDGLDNFTLIFNITNQVNFHWWDVEDIEIHAFGSLIKDVQMPIKWSGAVMKSVNMGADKNFGYACSRPNELYYSASKEHLLYYGLKFEDIHLQPFNWSRAGNFTFSTNVDDCVPFFSAGVWMFLVAAFIFVSIIISGMVFLNSLNTVNRFDDPKAKALVITAKE
jgi:V-type H+-transporting ATPase S1 subunit